MPTPGAVMQSTMLLYEHLGPLLTLDVGGATTDVHSIIPPSEAFKRYAEGETLEKRTVEGDLGVYVNRFEVLKFFPSNHEIQKSMPLLEGISFLPNTPIEEDIYTQLTRMCVQKALDRHVGDLQRVYTTQGHKFIPEGRDASLLETIVLTGGPLIHQTASASYLKDYFNQKPMKLLPTHHVTILKDSDYLMASLGVLSLQYPSESLTLLRSTLKEVGTCIRD